MKKFSFIAAMAALFLVAPVLYAQSATPTIRVTATNWAFTPSTITLHLNQPVNLAFVATEGIHGITIPDLGVNDVINISTSPSEISVTPKKLGTFVAHCAVFCGIGHEKMILTVKVVK